MSLQRIRRFETFVALDAVVVLALPVLDAVRLQLRGRPEGLPAVLAHEALAPPRHRHLLYVPSHHMRLQDLFVDVALMTMITYNTFPGLVGIPYVFP